MSDFFSKSQMISKPTENEEQTEEDRKEKLKEILRKKQQNRKISNEEIFNELIKKGKQQYNGENNLENNLEQLEKSTVLFIQEGKKLKYNFNKIILDLEKLVESVDLQKQNSPFLPNTFSLWRKQFYEKLENMLKFQDQKQKNKWILKFAQIVDTTILNKFLNKMQDAYFTLIYHEHEKLPKDLNVSQILIKHKLNNQVQELAQVMAYWSIQLELTQDLIERAELYDIYKSQVQLIELRKMKLKFVNNYHKFSPSKVQPQNFSQWMQSLLSIQTREQAYKFALSIGSNKIKSVIESKQFGISTFFTIGYAILSGNPTTSWISMLLAGVGSQYLGGMLENFISQLEKDECNQEMQLMVSQFNQISEKMKVQNELCSDVIIKCMSNLVANGELQQDDIEDLQEAIQQIIPNQENQEIIFDSKSKQNLKASQCQNQWTEVDYDNQYEEVEEDGFCIIQPKKENLQNQQKEFKQQSQIQELNSDTLNKIKKQASCEIINEEYIQEQEQSMEIKPQQTQTQNQKKKNQTSFNSHKTNNKNSLLESNYVEGSLKDSSQSNILSEEIRSELVIDEEQESQKLQNLQGKNLKNSNSRSINSSNNNSLYDKFIPQQLQERNKLIQQMYEIDKDLTIRQCISLMNQCDQDIQKVKQNIHKIQGQYQLEDKINYIYSTFQEYNKLQKKKLRQSQLQQSQQQNQNYFSKKNIKQLFVTQKLSMSEIYSEAVKQALECKHIDETNSINSIAKQQQLQQFICYLSENYILSIEESENIMKQYSDKN